MLPISSPRRSPFHTATLAIPYRVAHHRRAAGDKPPPYVGNDALSGASTKSETASPWARARHWSDRAHPHGKRCGLVGCAT